MSNFEQNSTPAVPESQQSPLLNKDSFLAAARCITSQHGLPIPVDGAEFPNFADLKQAVLALEILTGAHAGMASWVRDFPRTRTYICNNLYMVASSLIQTKGTHSAHTYNIVGAITKYIAACLEGNDTYGGWLVVQSHNDIWLDHYPANTARLQWLEHMIGRVKATIEQLEENGAAACTQQEVYLSTPARWLTTK